LSHHSQAFEVSWTPEGKGDATVLLSLPYDGGICYCDAPDSAGRLVVGANLLSPISAGQNVEIKLARLTISTVTQRTTRRSIWLAPSFRQDRLAVE